MHEFAILRETPYLECDSLYMAANPQPCWSLAQSQLPHLRPPLPLLPSPRHCPFPTNTTLIYIQMILFLSGTGLDKKFISMSCYSPHF